MRNLLLTLRFDGRALSGWQVQKNAPTVMQAFQDALEALFHERPDVKGCSRTDSGVSAAQYCVSLRLETPISCAQLVKALNTKLPRTIVALSCREVPEDFHARYSCRGKRYCYRILNAPMRDPFCEGLAYFCPQPLDAALLHEQAQAFVGTHDFSAFCNAGSDVKDRVRTIFACSVTKEQDTLLLRVEGDGFLYNMVRIMAGTLIEIGRGKLAAGSIPSMIAGRDRAQVGMTAPACGLLLEAVFYDL